MTEFGTPNFVQYQESCDPTRRVDLQCRFFEWQWRVFLLECSSVEIEDFLCSNYLPLLPPLLVPALHLASECPRLTGKPVPVDVSTPERNPIVNRPSVAHYSSREWRYFEE